jgi:hypothetical protein
MAELYDEPLRDLSHISVYLIPEYARQSVKIVSVITSCLAVRSRLVFNVGDTDGSSVFVAVLGGPP